MNVPCPIADPGPASPALNQNVRAPACMKCRNAPPRKNSRTRCGSVGTRTLPHSRLFVSRDPAVDLLLEHVERHRAVAQHLVVERGELELRAQRLLGLLAQLDDLELADLVGQRL